jgi:hypothetical protein
MISNEEIEKLRIDTQRLSKLVLDKNQNNPISIQDRNISDELESYLYENIKNIKKRVWQIDVNKIEFNKRKIKYEIVIDEMVIDYMNLIAEPIVKTHRFSIEAYQICYERKLKLKKLEKQSL